MLIVQIISLNGILTIQLSMSSYFLIQSKMHGRKTEINLNLILQKKISIMNSLNIFLRTKQRLLPIGSQDHKFLWLSLNGITQSKYLHQIYVENHGFYF